MSSSYRCTGYWLLATAGDLRLVKGFLCVFVCFMASIFCVLVYFLPFVLCCQYQCKRLPGKTRVQNDLLCVERDIKLCSFTHPFVTVVIKRPGVLSLLLIFTAFKS